MRRHYLDNARWLLVLTVLAYHVFYLFNSVGVIRNIAPPGIPILDSVLCFTYPWLMVTLFLIAGICARYSLEFRSVGTFLKERTVRLLLPSVAGIFCYCWIGGYLTDQSVNMFGSAPVPGLLRYLVYCLMGIGPLWFAHTLFLASLLLGLVRKLDRNDRLWSLCGRVPFPVLPLLFLAVWGASPLLIVPMISVYRFGIYFLVFFLGYFLFSHDRVLDQLGRFHLPLAAAALLCGAAYVWVYYGQNYSSPECLQSCFTNLYAWTAALAILGCARARLDFRTPLTAYLTSRTFSLYILHFPCLLVTAYCLTTFFTLPIPLNYLLVLLLGGGAAFLLCELVRRVPGLRLLILGIQN